MQQPRRGNDPPPLRPCVQRGPREVCPRPFLVPAPVFPHGCAAPRACPCPPSSPRVQRGRAPPLCTRGEVRGLSPPPPPLSVPFAPPFLCGACERKGGLRRGTQGRNAKGTPPSPPLCPRPPVDARPPSARPRPLPPFCARHSRPLPLRGMRKGRGEAGREKYAPLPSPSPVAARSARPLPPVRHTCKEGVPCFARAAKWGGGLSLPHSACTLPLWGMRKGRGGLKRETRGSARRVCPLPFALALPRCHMAPQCVPSPPGLPHVQRGSAPALHTQ
jgi:hypothetical protein